MEYICEDKDSKWFFNEETKKFARIYNNDQHPKEISGDNIPDPNKLCEVRCNHFGVPLGTEKTSTFGGIYLSEPQRLKPTPAVFAIWKRWQHEVSHAD